MHLLFIHLGEKLHEKAWKIRFQHLADIKIPPYWCKALIKVKLSYSYSWDHIISAIVLIPIDFDPVTSSFYVFGHYLKHSNSYCSQSNSRMD